MMLIGIMYSEGYSRIVSKHHNHSRDFTEEQNQNMVLLFLNDPKQMAGYQLLYKSEGMSAEGVPGYVKKSFLSDTQDPHYKVLKQELEIDGTVYGQRGDTLYFRVPENTFHEVEFTSMKSGRSFKIFPRTQRNDQMGQTIVSPDIEKQWNRDLYTYVALQHDFEEKYTDWSEKETIQLDSIGQRFF